MVDISGKIDQIINSLSTVVERLDSIESRISLFENKTEANERRIGELESNQIKLEQRISELGSQINEVKTETEEAQAKARHNELSRDLYSKRFNYLIHGLEENPNNAWETREQTEQWFRTFVTEGLKIDDPNSINIVDIHRLPQFPIYDKLRRKINRPIIVKLASVFDKQKFSQNLKNLKTFNAKRRTERASTPYVYATEHLPRELQLQKNKLIPLFREARRKKEKTFWKLQNGEYCLFVNDKRIMPRTSDNSDNDTSDTNTSDNDTSDSNTSGNMA